MRCTGAGAGALFATADRRRPTPGQCFHVFNEHIIIIIMLILGLLNLLHDFTYAIGFVIITVLYIFIKKNNKIITLAMFDGQMAAIFENSGYLNFTCKRAA